MTEVFQSIVFLLSPWPLFYVFVGVTLGIAVGAIPGLTVAMLITLSLPLTFYMDSTLAIVLLVSMYVGGISGGLITSTLLRIPGTPASVVTTFDGYPLAKSGQPGRAVGHGIMASFIGGMISWIFLVLLSPPLARIALKFGPFEYFSMVLMALVLIASVTEDSFLKGLISGLLGFLVAIPGLDPITGLQRMDFGYYELTAGFNLLPVLVGLFGISQIISDTVNINSKMEKLPMNTSGLFMKLKDMRAQAVNLVRSSLIGTWIGILPGIGANIGSILAYSAAKNTSKTPEKFGHGSEEGIVASEAANNATIGGALIPLITMGIPGSIIDAILLGALYIHNVQAGPLLFKTHPEIAYGVIGTALIANIFMFIIMLAATPFITKLIEVPKSCLLPSIIVFCVIGMFSLSNRMFDVWTMLSFGVIGYALEHVKVPLGPFIIGLVLEPVAESHLREGLMASAGSFLPLVMRPVSLAFLIVAIITFVWSIYRELIKPKTISA
jgi:putative tricarboxylic transport membrane protein